MKSRGESRQNLQNRQQLSIVFFILSIRNHMPSCTLVLIFSYREESKRDCDRRNMLLLCVFVPTPPICGTGQLFHKVSYLFGLRLDLRGSEKHVYRYCVCWNSVQFGLQPVLLVLWYNDCVD